MNALPFDVLSNGRHFTIVWILVSCHENPLNRRYNSALVKHPEADRFGPTFAIWMAVSPSR
jgi:hypothetical protein